MLSVIFTLIAAPAWACSCGSAESGYVSEIIEGYQVFWGVPTAANITKKTGGRPGHNVKYKIDVLENYNRFVEKQVDVTSSIEDGGSCGVQLTIGVPQIMTAWEYKPKQYNISSCAPSPPYEALKLYLEDNIDTFIPDWSECHTWKTIKGIKRPVLNAEREDCQVWEDEGVSDRYYYGYQDLSKYRKLWWDRIDKVD